MMLEGKKEGMLGGWLAGAGGWRVVDGGEVSSPLVLVYIRNKKRDASESD